MAHLDYLDEAIDEVSGQIDVVMAPFADELARLDTIHGVNQRTAITRGEGVAGYRKLPRQFVHGLAVPIRPADVVRALDAR